MFQGNLQQDAHEFLRCILGYIQDAAKEVNKYRKNIRDASANQFRKKLAVVKNKRHDPHEKKLDTNQQNKPSGNLFTKPNHDVKEELSRGVKEEDDCIRISLDSELKYESDSKSVTSVESVVLLEEINEVRPSPIKMATEIKVEPCTVKVEALVQENSTKFTDQRGDASSTVPGDRNETVQDSDKNDTNTKVVPNRLSRTKRASKKLDTDGISLSESSNNDFCEKKHQAEIHENEEIVKNSRRPSKNDRNSFLKFLKPLKDGQASESTKPDKSLPLSVCGDNKCDSGNLHKAAARKLTGVDCQEMETISSSTRNKRGIKRKSPSFSEEDKRRSCRNSSSKSPTLKKDASQSTGSCDQPKTGIVHDKNNSEVFPVENCNVSTANNVLSKCGSKKRLGMRGAVVSPAFTVKPEPGLNLDTVGGTAGEWKVVLSNKPVKVETNVPRSESVTTADLKTQALTQGKQAVVKLKKLDSRDLDKYHFKPKSVLEITRKTDIVTDCVERLFQGTMAHRTKCLECESYNERKEEYQDISVPVKKDSKERHKEESDDEEGGIYILLLSN